MQEQSEEYSSALVDATPSSEKKYSYTKKQIPVLGLTCYQVLVLISSWIGWGFDVFDSILFSYAAPYCVPDLLGLQDRNSKEAKDSVAFWTAILTALLLVGWSIGGIAFGILCDKIGRTKTMLLTILTYSLGTFICAFSFHIYFLAVFRFISALGIGGEWSSSTTLVNESLPKNRRIFGSIVMSSAAPFGSIIAFVTTFLITSQYTSVLPGWLAWRVVFASAIVPSLLGIIIRAVVKEPESWNNLKKKQQQNQQTAENDGITPTTSVTPKSSLAEEEEEQTAESPFSPTEETAVVPSSSSPSSLPDNNNNNKQPKTLRDLFTKAYLPRIIGGTIMVVTCMASIYIVSQFMPILSNSLAYREYSSLPAAELKAKQDLYSSIANLGFHTFGFIGNYLLLPLVYKIGRMWTFRIYFFGGFVCLLITFMPWIPIPSLVRILLVWPVGLFVSGVTALFSFYLPELFDTEIRGTGCGFCWNVGRMFMSWIPFCAGFVISRGVDPLYVFMAVAALPLFGLIFSFTRVLPETTNDHFVN